MLRSQELAQERRAKQAIAQQLVAKGNALTTEEKTQAVTLTKELKALGQEYDEAVEFESATEQSKNWVDKITGEPVNIKHSTGGWEPAGETVLEHGKDFKGREYFEKIYEEGAGMLDEKQMAAISSNEYKRAWRNLLRKDHRMLTTAELKILQEGIDPQGGYLVPDDVLSRIIQKKPTPTRVAGRVEQFTTSRDAIVMPKVNYTTDDLYTTGIRVTWTGEIPSSASAAQVTDPSFGQVRIPVHTAMMLALLTNDQVDDAAFPLVSWVSDKFNETIDLTKDNMILNGTGSGQPAGILLNPGGTNQPAIVVSGSASALTADGLVSLNYSVPEQYRDNLTYVMNLTNTAKAIALLKDSQNRYLFRMGMANDGGLQGKNPDSLLGQDITYSGFMPNVGTSTFPVIFGDLRGYYLVNRTGFSIQVLREVYATVNQIGMVGRIRLGGQVAEDWRIKIHQCHT